MSCPRVSHSSIQVGVTCFGKIGEIFRANKRVLAKVLIRGQAQSVCQEGKNFHESALPSTGFPSPSIQVRRYGIDIEPQNLQSPWEALLQSLPLQTKVPPSCTLVARKLLLFAQPRDSLYQHSGTLKHDIGDVTPHFNLH